MNYYTIRLTVTLLIFILLFVVDRIVVKRIFANIKQILCIFCFILVIIYFFPFEKIFAKFDSVEKAFDYYFPNSDLVEKYIFDNYAFILYFNGKSTSFTHFEKSNGNWYYSSSIGWNSKGKIYDNRYLGIIHYISKENVTGVVVIFSGTDKDKSYVGDSLSSEFDKVVYNNGQLNAYVAIVDTKLDDNYSININGKDYVPLK